VLPILVLCYRRLDTLKQTIESITVQPHGLIYISCDGVSAEHYEEGKQVHTYLNHLLDSGVVEEIRISDINQGTLIGVSEGIDWFFEKVEMGIILEDDLVLEPELLSTVEIVSKYLRDSKVVAIGLHNSVPLSSITDRNSLVRSSRFVISWGWVTTRENWNTRVKSYAQINYWILFYKMLKVIGISSALYHIYFYRNRVRTERENIRQCTWADLWQINCFIKNLKVISYNRNMVTNVGFGTDATHTIEKRYEYPIYPTPITKINLEQFNEEIQAIDKKAEKYFIKNRKITTIIRAKLRLRQRFF